MPHGGQAPEDQRSARVFRVSFCFSGEDVYKQVGNLSGGQRSRLALARLAQLGGNFLVLDEPTNHLDIRSRDVLQDALHNYEGTILFASHDRYLISALATQIWEIEGQSCQVYNGNYDFYLRKRNEVRSARNSMDQQAKKRAQRPKASSDESKQKFKQLKKQEF